MARLPWYAFLYRLFGAQGTFWLWVVALIAIWWTAKPTVARLANRQPRDLRVVDVAQLSATDQTRWVSLRGVEVRLDRALLLREPTGAAPVWLLLDPSDPAATWWARTRALADVMVSARAPQPTAPAALGGAGGFLPKHARQRLQERLARLEGGSAEALPTPGRVVLVQREDARLGRPAARGDGPPPNPLDFEARLAARLDERAALIRERVRSGLVDGESSGARVEPRVVQGLLVATPVTLAARVKQDVDTVIAPWILQADREPRDLESWVFAAAAVTLLFLTAGFAGASRAGAGPAPAA